LAYGLNIFDLQVHSFDGELPSSSLQENIQRPGFYGKGIVYAKRDVVVPETAGWRQKCRRDIPFPGEEIETGRPICTVLAQGESRDECWHRLLAEADAVSQEVGIMGGNG
jgi:predicted ATP-grasp superfamily ATP-dependent carboligase